MSGRWGVLGPRAGVAGVLLAACSCLLDAAFLLSPLETMPSSPSWRCADSGSETGTALPLQEFRRGIPQRQLELRGLSPVLGRERLGGADADLLAGRPGLELGITRIERCSEITKPDSLRIFLFGTPHNHRAPPA